VPEHHPLNRHRVPRTPERINHKGTARPPTLESTKNKAKQQNVVAEILQGLAGESIVSPSDFARHPLGHGHG